MGRSVKKSERFFFSPSLVSFLPLSLSLSSRVSFRSPASVFSLLYKRRAPFNSLSLSSRVWRSYLCSVSARVYVSFLLSPLESPPPP